MGEVLEPANTHYAFPSGLVLDLDASLPAALGALQGVWCGTWGGYVPAILVIDRVQANGGARLVYGWGDSIHGIRKAMEQRADLWSLANCPDGRLVVALHNGKVEIEPVSHGELFGLYKEGEAVRNCIYLRRIFHAEGSDSLRVEHLRVPMGGAESLCDSTMSLYCTVYRDQRRSQAPLLLLNHGSAAGVSGPTVTWLYDAQARYFVERGYAVVVPMRRGRGKSDGPFVESGEEDTDAFCEMEISAGLTDLRAVSDYVSRKDWASASPCILAGQSRGGFLSLLAASELTERVAAVINFSAGWWDENSRSTDYQLRRLQDAGARTAAPTIWLYCDADCFYGPAHIERLHSAFRHTGAAAEMHLFPSIGHDLIEYLHLWRPEVDGFLAALGQTCPRGRLQPSDRSGQSTGGDV